MLAVGHAKINQKSGGRGIAPKGPHRGTATTGYQVPVAAYFDILMREDLGWLNRK